MKISTSPAGPAAFPRSVRTGQSTLEKAAVERFRACLPAIPAETLVQVSLWPETVQGFARWAGIASVHAYNTLTRANGRPYHANRSLYALRLGLSKADLDAAIDRPRLSAEELPEWARRWAWGTPLATSTTRPGVPGDHRDGSLAMEQLALCRVQENIAALPKGLVLQLLHWPVSLRELAATLNVEEQKWYNLLSFQRGMRYSDIRSLAYAAYAAHGIDPGNFDYLVEAAPAEAVPLPEVPAPARAKGSRSRG